LLGVLDLAKAQARAKEAEAAEALKPPVALLNGHANGIPSTE
jgi:hypothetical protein